MSITVTPRIEMYLPEGGDGYAAAGWVDISEDVPGGVKAEWGMRGGGPQDRVADPGTMAFDLDNSSVNSAGLAGYYSPGREGAREGFVLGVPVRLMVDHPLFGSRLIWQGAVERIELSADIRRPWVSVSCADWMEEAARAKPQGLAVLTGVQSDEVFEALIGAIEKQPPNGTLIIGGSDVYPYALDNIQDEKGRIASEFQRLAASELGFIFVEAGQLVFEGRRRRAGSGGIKFALDDLTYTDLKPDHSRDNIKNRVQATVHPRRVDTAATTVLFSLGSAQEIVRGTEFTITAAYRDPNQPDKRCGGVGMVTPEAGTDYAFNSDAGGAGADLTSQIDVTATFGGNAAVLTVRNNGPADGHLTLLQLRGRGLYDFEPIISDCNDADSVEEYGENVFAFDMPYQSSPAAALDTAQFLLALNKDPSTRVSSVTFVANWSDEVLLQAFNCAISDRISITAAALGLDAQPFFINGVQWDISRSGIIRVTWTLAPVDTTQFWLLDVPGRTELDETTVLGYGLFVPGWILGQSALGSDTFLA